MACKEIILLPLTHTQFEASWDCLEVFWSMLPRIRLVSKPNCEGCKARNNNILLCGCAWDVTQIDCVILVEIVHISSVNLLSENVGCQFQVAATGVVECCGAYKRRNT